MNYFLLDWYTQGLSLSRIYLYFYFAVKKSEVECLLRVFHSLVEKANVRLNNFGLDRNAFRAILHSIFGMTDDMLMNRGKSLKKLKWAKLRWQYIWYMC